MQDYNSALVLSSWMTTVFYQLLCEVSSKDQVLTLSTCTFNGEQRVVLHAKKLQ